MRPTRQSVPNLAPDHARVQTGAAPSPPAGDAVYDSFIVRMWRTADAQIVRRIEVEHVQTGTVASAGAAAPEWILAQFDHGLGDPPPGSVPPPD